ncbi:hypothetical protein [Flavobacterium sp.]|nr:hypothetical protein [Flavobacterium sp.]MBP6127446.1 hypothetical protein [Flavobacterium sp.]
MRKIILIVIGCLVLASCGPRRLGCGPRRCEVKTPTNSTSDIQKIQLS